MHYFYDTTYILVVIGALLGAIASWNVKHTYNKYSRTGNGMGVTAEQVADRILRNAGIMDVRIERVGGNLTDHYSPKEKVLRLSDTVYGSTSVAAIGVAAHECGHAIQHNRGYVPIKIRAAVIPVANIGSSLSWPLMLLGLFMGWTGLMQLGIILFSAVVIFQIATLPVEFNASRRALRILEDSHILVGKELKYSKKVLRAAAMTYVAALLTAILQLLRLILLANRRERR
ncbi:MAG: zinc metallopeptidase [Butyribacter sp.]|nr:zinc metallopeptidase [bacterium]MDY3855385.1 zinc metallopeptidase [Butyribacter sp.]